MGGGRRHGVDGLARREPLLDVVGAVGGGEGRLDGVREGHRERGDVAEVRLGGEDLGWVSSAGGLMLRTYPGAALGAGRLCLQAAEGGGVWRVRIWYEGVDEQRRRRGEGQRGDGILGSRGHRGAA